MNPMFYVMYVVVAVLVGISGIRRKFGFWGYFFASLLFSPVIGILLVFASSPSKTVEKRGSSDVSSRRAL